MICIEFLVAAAFLHNLPYFKLSPAFLEFLVLAQVQWIAYFDRVLVDFEAFKSPLFETRFDSSYDFYRVKLFLPHLNFNKFFNFYSLVRVEQRTFGWDLSF